jgi:hypothetical protein
MHENSSHSDTNERGETENGTIYSHDSGYENECCPASPITVPRPRMGSASRPRRQRTTSTSQNTIRPNEAIIRCNHRTIYTGNVAKKNSSGISKSNLTQYVFFCVRNNYQQLADHHGTIFRDNRLSPLSLEYVAVVLQEKLQ